HSFAGGALLNVGVADERIRNGTEPHGDTPFEVTPETYKGSFFEAATSTSRRVQGTAALYLPPREWLGRHYLKLGLDLDQINFGEELTRSPSSYLREDGTLLRRSTFPAQEPFNRNNFEVGSYLQDRWIPHAGWLLEAGLRFDWDEIIRPPLYSPRFAAVSTPGAHTKLSAGIG